MDQNKDGTEHEYVSLDEGDTDSVNDELFNQVGWWGLTSGCTHHLANPNLFILEMLDFVLVVITTKTKSNRRVFWWTDVWHIVIVMGYLRVFAYFDYIGL